VRALGLIAAALHVVLCVVAAFLIYFIATFPFENQSPEAAAGDDWLIGAAAIMLLLAIAIGGAVIARRATVAAIATAAQFVVAAIVLTYALGESDHSDGRLLLYATVVAVTAVAGVTATHAERR
jgi:quinol-cytochrome oxidoreductase complex cytochrome b subunit